MSAVCGFGVVDAIVLVVLVWMKACVCVCGNCEKQKGREGEDMFARVCALVLWWMHACVLHP